MAQGGIKTHRDFATIKELELTDDWGQDILKDQIIRITGNKE